MSYSHILQYFIIAIIAITIMIIIFKRIQKIRSCNDKNDVCQCCSSKSICGKAKKRGQHIANSKN